MTQSSGQIAIVAGVIAMITVVLLLGLRYYWRRWQWYHTKLQSSGSLSVIKDLIFKPPEASILLPRLYTVFPTNGLNQNTTVE